MYGVEDPAALLFLEDLGEDGDDPLALEVGGVEQLDELEHGVEVDAVLAHENAHALDGVVVIEHQESIIISSGSILCLPRSDKLHSQQSHVLSRVSSCSSRYPPIRCPRVCTGSVL